MTMIAQPKKGRGFSWDESFHWKKQLQQPGQSRINNFSWISLIFMKLFFCRQFFTPASCLLVKSSRRHLIIWWRLHFDLKQGTLMELRTVLHLFYVITAILGLDYFFGYCFSFRKKFVKYFSI